MIGHAGHRHTVGGSLHYYGEPRHSEAEALFRRSLAIEEKTIGGEHPDTVVTLHWLAALYRSQGRYGEVEPLLLRWRSTRKRWVASTPPRRQR